MQSYIVTGMDEKGTRSSYPAGKGNGIIDKLVGMVRFVETKRIDNEDLNIVKLVHLSLVDGLHISNIGQSTNAIGCDRQFAMHHLEWHHLKITKSEQLVRLYLM